MKYSAILCHLRTRSTLFCSNITVNLHFEMSLYSVDISNLSTFDGLVLYKVKGIVCQRNFEWIVEIELHDIDSKECNIDVTPSMASFSSLNYDPYAVRDELLTSRPNLNNCYDMNAVANILINNLIESQMTILNDITNSRYASIHV